MAKALGDNHISHQLFTVNSEMSSGSIVTDRRTSQ